MVAKVLEAIMIILFLHPREVLSDAAPKGISERTSYHPA